MYDRLPAAFQRMSEMSVGRYAVTGVQTLLSKPRPQAFEQFFDDENIVQVVDAWTGELRFRNEGHRRKVTTNRVWAGPIDPSPYYLELFDLRVRFTHLSRLSISSNSQRSRGRQVHKHQANCRDGKVQFHHDFFWVAHSQYLTVR